MKRILHMLCLALVLIAMQIAGASAQTDFTWDDTATTISLADGATQIEGSGATADGDTITIDAAGTYVLSGTLTDGQIRIAASKNDMVRLVLSGVSISNSESAPIYASKAENVVVILADGTQNTLTDAEAYTYEADEDEPDAALFSKDSMTIGGNGSLTVTGNFNNGIGSKDDLLIDGGTITVTAANDGLRGRDSLTINGGDITITAGNDGMKANNTDADKGWIEINGGTLNITADFDGIQAESNLTVNGGDIQIVSGGGASNAPVRASTQGGRGGWQQTTTETTVDSDSMKGLKAGVDQAINGGMIVVDSADDSVHANGNVTIAGGNLTLASGDDGVHADGDLLITAGEIDVTQSFEGLEGATVTISGGNTSVVASDDGINAAGGSDDAGGGMFGQDAFRAGGSDQYYIDISGGVITVNAEGDGLDSNGNLTISGGMTVVHGPVSGGNSPLDADGTMAVTGGTVMAAGSSQMPELPGSSSTQPTIALYYASAKPEGTVAVLKDENDNVLAEYTAAKSVQMVIFSVPELQEGSTYMIETDGANPVEVTISSSGTTGISDTGAAVSGGGRGGFGGGMMPPGAGGERPGGGGGQRPAPGQQP